MQYPFSRLSRFPHRIIVWIILGCGTVFLVATLAGAQEIENGDRLSTWLLFQGIPSYTVASTSSQSRFGFEWEATPLLYSFGLTKLVSPWRSFFVEPTARFTGSIELVLTGQAFPKKFGPSHFGSSVQLLGHLPLNERGEHLALHVGIGQYFVNGSTPIMKIVGFSTFFGILHFTFRHSAAPSIWMGSLEFRIF